VLATVDLHQLVADDVEPHEEHAVLRELRQHDLCQVRLADLRARVLAPTISFPCETTRPV